MYVGKYVGKKFKVKIKVLRSNPSNGQGPYYQEYLVDADYYTTVLDALLDIREHQDSTLQLRYSCRMGMCGSDGMKINGKPALACQTLLRNLGKEVTVEPMNHFPVVRDLVTNTEEFFIKYKSVKPYLIESNKEIQENPTSPNKQYPSQVMEYLSFNYCIQCGLCYSACPIVGSDPHYLGPAALTVAYRYSTDSRDFGIKTRIEIVGGKEGTERCHFAGECTEVCPKGVNPSFAIQKLRKMISSEEIKSLFRRKRDYE